MGNRINQELYGPETNAAWAFHIDPRFPCQEPAGSPNACGLPDRLTPEAAQWYQTHGFHPTFFYEMLWNLLGFVVLWVGGRKLVNWLRDGDVFLSYMIWYGVGRFWVEMFRPDAWRIGQLATAQWVALGFVVIGFVGIIINHLRPRHEDMEPVEDAASVGSGRERRSRTRQRRTRRTRKRRKRLEDKPGHLRETRFSFASSTHPPWGGDGRRNCRIFGVVCYNLHDNGGTRPDEP